MAINLARMGSIPRADDGFTYDPADEARKIQVARDLRRKAAQDLRAGEIDLAAKALAQKELERTTREGEKDRGIRSNFLVNREGALDVPVGVRSPEFLEQERPSNAPFGPMDAPAPRNKMESGAFIDLARNNPDLANQFRSGLTTERQGLEDRSRKIASEDQKQIQTGADFAYKKEKDASDAELGGDKLGETKRHNQMVEQLTRMGILAKGSEKPKGKILPSNRVTELSESASGLDLLGNLRKGTPPGMNPLTSWFRTKNPFDTDAQTFNQYLATTKQVIGKALEGGVLRLEDEKKYEKILPKGSDTRGVRRRKEAQLAEMIANKRNRALQDLGAAGYDIEGQVPSELDENDAATLWAMRNQNDPRAQQWLRDLDKDE